MKYSRAALIHFLLIAATFTGFPSMSVADTVTLTDGTVFKGDILTDTKTEVAMNCKVGAKYEVKKFARLKFKSPWMSHGIVARYPVTRTPPRRWSWRKVLRGECEGCQCATLSPDICIEAQRRYTECMESLLRRGFVGRLPATLEKCILIN